MTLAPACGVPLRGGAGDPGGVLDREVPQDKARDRRVQKALEALWWRVITIWECETKQDGLTELLVQRLGGKAKPKVKARRR